MEHDTYFEEKGVESAGEGAAAILRERKKQIEVYGFDAESDADGREHEELLAWAAFMLLNEKEAAQVGQMEVWQKLYEKHSYKERLAIAGAFIAAEIDRISYVESQQGEEE